MQKSKKSTPKPEAPPGPTRAALEAEIARLRSHCVELAEVSACLDDAIVINKQLLTERNQAQTTLRNTVDARDEAARRNIVREDRLTRIIRLMGDALEAERRNGLGETEW